MIIANPIFDVTFKHLIENISVAKFMIGTILGCEILTLEQNNNEMTLKIEAADITIFRRDYVATIETKAEGKQKVLIEVQKAKNTGDIKKFRKYLGGEYFHSVMPIITIFILGFNLDVESPAFMANPTCTDLITNENIDHNETFIKLVTHKVYFIQTRRIKSGIHSDLEKLLSIFAQKDFMDEKKTIRSIEMIEGKPELKKMMKILENVASDSNLMVKLNKEANKIIMEECFLEDIERKEAQYINQLHEMKIGMAERDNALAEKDNTIAEKDNALVEKDNALAKKDNALAEKDNALAEKDNALKKTVLVMHKAGIPINEIAETTNLNISDIENMIKNSLKEE